MKRKGFTLVEMLIVVIIIGVLAAIAIPQFMGVVRKSKISEAKTTLRSMLNAEKVYFVEYNQFTLNFEDADPVYNDGAPENTYDTANWQYTLAMGADLQELTITANEKRGGVLVPGSTITIDHNGVFAENLL